MAKTEQDLRQELTDAIGAFATEKRLKKERAPEVARYVEDIYSKIVSHASQYLTQSDIEKINTPGNSERFGIAMEALSKMELLAAKRRAAGIAIDLNTTPTQGDFAQASVKILKNKTQYGLEDKNEEELMEVMWYATGATSELDPETIKKEALEKKKLERKKELEGKVKNPIARERQYIVDAAKISSQGLSEKELRNARREATILYFEKLASDEQKSSLSIDTLGELKSAQIDIISVASMGGVGKDLVFSAGAKEKIDTKLLELGKKVPGISNLMKIGEGAQFFTNPEKYFTSKFIGRVGASVVANNAALQAGLTAIAALTGPVGIAARAALLAVQQLIGERIARYVATTRDIIRENVKRAGAAIAGVATLFIVSIGTGTAMAAAAAGATAVILVPLVVFFILIINSGGYMVPPGSKLTVSSDATTSSVTENAYISVTKTANPPGPFPNVFSQSVEYTITVSAKQSPLTNISFTYECLAIGSRGTSIPCPPTPVIPSAPPQIDPGTPFVFKYTQTYGGSFRNSVIMDTLKVNATAGGESNTASGFAAVMFGTPPTRCFVFATSWDNLADQAAMTIAIARMGIEGKYLDKLCPPGAQITLERSHIPVTWGGYTQCNTVTIYDPAFGNDPVRSAFYTITHESGHVFACGHSSLFNDFGVTPPIPLPTDYDGYVCSYPNEAKAYNDENRRKENFAEGIALIYRDKTNYAPFDCITAKGGSFNTAYPAYYNFLRTRVFN